MKDAPAQPKFSAQNPVLLTSGQSADVQMVKVLLERNKIANKMNPQSGVETLSEVKSVIIVIDGSAKGWERPGRMPIRRRPGSKDSWSGSKK